jgi:hypothetical protein
MALRSCDPVFGPVRGAAGALIAIVSLGVVGDVLMHGTKVRFTTARGRASRSFDLAWFDDLERFELEAMAVLDMSDAPRR